MSKELNKLLINAYKRYKYEKNPLIPLEAIKEYLKHEGVDLDEKSDEKN